MPARRNCWTSLGFPPGLMEKADMHGSPGRPEPEGGRLEAPGRGRLRRLLAPLEVKYLLGAPTVVDLNEIADRSLSVHRLTFGQEGVAVAAFLDPGIDPVVGPEAGLVMLAVGLLRQVTVAPSAEGLAPAVEVVTGGVGGHVCLELTRVGVDVARAGWPMERAWRVFSRLLGGRLETRIAGGGMQAALRFPAVSRRTLEGEVWVLDDEAVVRDVVCRILSAEGLRTLAASSLEGLERRLASDPPDLLLVEATLSEVGRGRLLEWLARVHPELVRRIVVLTANPNAHPVRRVLACLERDWYLLKPFTPEALVGVVCRRLMCLAGR